MPFLGLITWGMISKVILSLIRPLDEGNVIYLEKCSSPSSVQPYFAYYHLGYTFSFTRKSPRFSCKEIPQLGYLHLQ